MQIDETRLEQEIEALGQEILSEMAESSSSLLDPMYYADRFLEWAMEDEEVKVSLFRFVDVLPSLPDAAAVIRHVQEYFRPLEGRVPDLLMKGLAISPNSLTAKVVSRAIRMQVRTVASRFILGESPAKALGTLQNMRQNRMAFTVDLVGEATVSEREAIDYRDRYLELLDALSTAVPSWPESKAIIEGHRAEAAPINISVKLSALYSQIKPCAEEHSIRVLSERFAEILRQAKEIGAFVYLDMEDSALTEITLQTFRATLSLEEFKDYPHCGIVMQAYLRRTEEDVVALLEWLKTRGTPIAVRLVKGAYWDTETVLAKQHGWPIPVWQEKCCSDAKYEKISRILLEHRELVLPAFGSHNIRSLCHAIKVAEALGIPKTEFEIQTLYGMGDEFKRAFVERGFLVREYAPIGELIPGMGYLVRRLLENTSNEGFIRKTVHEQVEASKLLQKPISVEEDTGVRYLSERVDGEFYNEPLRDFTLESSRSSLREEIEKLRRASESKPKEFGPIVSGSFLQCQTSLSSVSPEQATLVLAKTGLADSQQASKAIDSLHSFFPQWRDTDVKVRSAVLRDTAEILRTKREEFAAAAVLEAGKPWIEADADVAEAIDFLDFYALEAERLSCPRQLGTFAGERNTLTYEPRGTTVAISPWNFPIAIPCGMFAAALVTGNTVALKPAEQTPLCSYLLFQAFIDAGMPPEAAAFLPGIGEDIGPTLVDHPKVSTVVFTGSRAVGLELVRRGGEKHSEHVKRVIAEMGGKNAIIIDDDAELDEAVKGTIYSAFAFQGQKCSACSRLIIVGGNYDRILERLAEAVKSVKVGPPSDPDTFVGPVIDEEARDRLADAIARAEKESHLLAQGKLPKNLGDAYYVAPSIFTDIPDSHFLHTDELFGPVLAVSRAKTFDEALEMALDSEYGLTGGVFSRSPKNILRAAQEFRVGNLYINRPCTGALVMRQPFGGAKMSGVGSKAGGPDYLMQFVVPRTVTENTMRRGFVPDM